MVQGDILRHELYHGKETNKYLGEISPVRVTNISTSIINLTIIK